MAKIVITNAQIVNEGRNFRGSVLIENEYIIDVCEGKFNEIPNACETIDAQGKLLIPGVIDDQVHFREPGLTYKADIYSESKAAIAGGITSYMEMPNTIPQTISQQLLYEKFELAAQKSLANFSFYMGATNNNLDELLKTDPKTVCGIKVFMGASTGNMLVDNEDTLTAIFSQSPMLIATHCEDEQTIKINTLKLIDRYGEDIPFSQHPAIRSSEACYKSSALAVRLARKYGTRLHLLHLSTATEMALLDNSVLPALKQITGEVCVHHLWFDDSDYKRLNALIKWNPAIKTRHDKESLLAALINNKIDVVATDHAPHLLSEKNNSYLKCPSGAPMVQHSLVAMLEMCYRKQIDVEKIVEKMCHNPALIFKVNSRGFIRKGYYADLVLIDTKHEWEVSSSNILYKCGWSPLESQIFHSRVTHTFVNGRLAYNNGVFDESVRGMPLSFDR